MLTYDMNSRGNTPLYEYLAACIRNDIADGSIACDEKLPSKRALAAHLSIGIATVAAAYDQLLTEGFIRAEERRGFFAEDVSSFRQRSTDAADAPDIELPGQENADSQDYLIDLKANRTSVSLFPSSVWAKYMREALSLKSDRLLRTVPFNGLYELRCAIASHLKRSRGMRVSPDCIIVGAGSEYLYGRLLQMLGPSTIFAVEDPGYKKFAGISEASGSPWRAVGIDEAGLIVDELEESGADVVHLSPANHFPTGIVMPITRRLELFEWANRARKRYIIEDDYDSEFRYSGHLIMPLFAEDVSNKVIYMNAFSKTMAPSIRISYMVLPPRLMEKYVGTMSFYSCTVSSFEQYALARFIDEGHLDRHINRMRNFFRSQRTQMLAAIEASPLARVSTVWERNAGTHFMLHLDTAASEEELRRRGEAAGLKLSFLSDYLYVQRPGFESTLVMNYAGIEPENIVEAMCRLAEIIPECAN